MPTAMHQPTLDEADARAASPRRAPPAVAPATGDFPATRAAALERLANVDPVAYARTRNHLDGQVTRLGPYITHDLVSLDEVVSAARGTGRRATSDKLVFECAWRAYFHYAWRCLGTEGLFAPARRAPAAEYLPFVAVDIVEGRTGVRAIDESVRALYRDGYLHNHARMWLASYVIHLRKIDWRAAARWMYGYLLDGDLASNTLSWQWVAGTWTGRPYLFNDDNLRRYAPDWSQPGGPLDRDYGDLAGIAASRRIVADIAPRHQAEAPVDTPPVFPGPPSELELPSPIPARFTALDRLADGPLVLRHPWSLGVRPEVPGKRIGMLVSDFHAEFPWSARRWSFVLEAMAAATDEIVLATRAEWCAWLRGRRFPTHALSTLNPGYADVLDPRHVAVIPAGSPFADPERPCRSFSAYWKAVTATGSRA